MKDRGEGEGGRIITAVSPMVPTRAVVKRRTEEPSVKTEPLRQTAAGWLQR